MLIFVVIAEKRGGNLLKGMQEWRKKPTPRIKKLSRFTRGKEMGVKKKLITWKLVCWACPCLS